MTYDQINQAHIRVEDGPTPEQARNNREAAAKYLAKLKDRPPDPERDRRLAEELDAIIRRREQEDEVGGPGERV